MITSIAVVNRSSKPSTEVARFAAAMSKQVELHVAPVWQRYAAVYYAPDAAKVPASDWLVTLYDEPQSAEDAGALGYHETDGAVRPVGFVFTAYAERDGAPWTSVASHEVLEMLGDEWINELVMRQRPDGSLELWPRELCDAVQGSLYEVDGVSLSNFVYPGYFVEGYAGPKDHLGVVRSAFEVTPGGYSSLVTIVGGQATQRNVFGAAHPAWRRARAHVSRAVARARRFGDLPVEDVVLD